jgi:phosphoglycolate phosphatase
MKRAAVIFDLDGTLLDTLADIGSAANETLVAEGFLSHSLDAYKRFIGDGIETLFARALPREAGSAATIERCVARYRGIYERRWNDQARPYDGIEELLGELARRGVSMAVLSNKSHPFTVRCVEHFFPEVPFACVLGQRADTPLKPHPASALEILQRLQRAPSEVVYVGDTSTDMQTAVNAKLFAVGVLWGFRGRDELLQSGAQAIIAEPRELLAIIDC